VKIARYTVPFDTQDRGFVPIGMMEQWNNGIWNNAFLG